ncbi:MAG: hypothetical protein HOK34_06290 [Gammaproteobacteria bacterium]|jgi:hypothetical protein|nr:hypothetical protein [Gammaproteobacteria bacterium]
MTTYQIDNNFSIRADTRQYILEYKAPRKKVQHFFFSRLESLSRFVVELKLKQLLNKRFIKTVSFPKILPYVDDKSPSIEEVLRSAANELQLILEDEYER